MTLIGKVGSVVAAIGMVGGGVATINHFYSGFRTISERLTGIGFEVLDVNKGEDVWKAIEDAYSKEQDANKKFGKTINTAKENCRIALQKNPSDPSLYKLASKWCVKPEKMEEMLKRNKYKKLEKSTGNDGNKSKWEEKIRKLKSYTGEEKITIDFSKVTTEDAQITTLQSECEKIIAEAVVTHSDDKFEQKYMQAREWCTEKEK